jgi:hypothetical protein
MKSCFWTDVFSDMPTLAWKAVTILVAISIFRKVGWFQTFHTNLLLLLICCIIFNICSWMGQAKQPFACLDGYKYLW